MVPPGKKKINIGLLKQSFTKVQKKTTNKLLDSFVLDKDSLGPGNVRLRHFIGKLPYFKAEEKLLEASGRRSSNECLKIKGLY